MNNYELTEDQLGLADWFNTVKHLSKNLILTGAAGTGKTSALCNLAEMTGYNKILFACPTHQAKNVLAAKLDDNANITTVAKLTGVGRVFDGGRMKFLKVKTGELNQDEKYKLLIIDEASMLDSQTIKPIMYMNFDNILYVGDKNQLPPVNSTRAPIFNIVDFSKDFIYKLTEQLRQDKNSNILKLASACADVNNRSTLSIGLKRLINDAGIEFVTFTKDNIVGFFENNPNGICLVGTNATKDKVNAIGRASINSGIVPSEPYLKGDRLVLESPIINGPNNGDTIVVVSDPVESEIQFTGVTLPTCEMMIKATNGRYKNQVMTIEVARDTNAKKTFELMLNRFENEYNTTNDTIKKVQIRERVKDLCQHLVLASHAFAMTVHKAQGSTFDDVFLIVNDLYCFEKSGIFPNVVYTGVSRASNSLMVA